MRVDMHVHSSASFDCQVDPLEVLKRCTRLGLGPVFLTDHETLAGAQKLAEHGHQVVAGQEIATAEGDLIGLFLSRQVRQGLSMAATIDDVKSQGGLVYLQHPYDRRRRAPREETIEKIADSIDIVEVYNSRSDPDCNTRAGELRAALGAAAGAGSDAHRLNEIGRGHVVIEPFSGAADFLDKLRQATVVRDTSPVRLLVATGLKGRITRR